MSNKLQYIEYCKQAEVFLQIQPWWLDIVCGPSKWEVALSHGANDEIIGALPYYTLKKRRLSFLKMPPFTDYLGPWIDLPDEQQMKITTLQYKCQHIFDDLIKQLPDVHFFYQQYTPSFNDGLPLLWRAYHLQPMYTFIINLAQNNEAIFNNFNRNTRRNIQKAQASYRVERTDDSSRLFQLIKQLAQKQKRPIGFTPQHLQELLQGLLHHKQGILLEAKHLIEDETHAALLVGWDQQSAYLLLSASSNATAPSLLHWEAIQRIPEHITKLDCCGSILPTISPAIMGLGGKQTSYLKASKCKNAFWRSLARMANTEYAG